MRTITTTLTAFSLLTTVAVPAFASIEDSARALVEQRISGLLSDTIVIDALHEQNTGHASLSQTDIDSLDQTWRKETGAGGGDMTRAVLDKPLSNYLRKVVQDGQGLFTEVFVMDNHGLNVGQSGLTSDYWQGDEAKWQETYLKGDGAIHVSEVEFDESSQTYQVQVSVAITDPGSQHVIGAATFGVNAEAIE